MRAPRPSRPAEPRVCVFGESIVDELPTGPLPGGAPLNVAGHAAAFGLAPLLLTRVGRDAPGALLVSALRSAGVPEEGVQEDPALPTGRAVVTFRGGSPRFEIPPGSAFDAIDAEAAVRAVRAFRPRVVAFGTLAQRDPVSRAALHEVLSATKATRLADLNLRAPWYDGAVVCRALSAAHVVKASDEELAEVRRLLCLPGRDDESLSAEVVRRFRLKALHVTRGARGAFVAERTRDGGVAFLESPASEPGGELVDTIGAGDAYTATVLLGLALGWTAPEALRRGVGFAGAVTRIAGALPAERSFYAPFLDSWRAAA